MKGIRKLMLECPNFVREAIITDHQIDLYRKVKARGLTGIKSSELAEEEGITIQNASTKLTKLTRQKYLRKIECVADSGGIEYTFLAIEF